MYMMDSWGFACVKSPGLTLSVSGLCIAMPRRTRRDDHCTRCAGEWSKRDRDSAMTSGSVEMPRRAASVLSSQGRSPEQQSCLPPPRRLSCCAEVSSGSVVWSRVCSVHR